VRWPAEPEDLYRALNEILGGTTSKGGTKEAPAIDPSVFASLEKSLGRPTLIEILQSYSTNSNELVDALAAATGAEQWSDAARIAQDIAGAASGFGLSALSAAARGLVQQSRAGCEPRALCIAAQSISDEHTRVRQALAGLYPELTA
jgi:HPt (histidine-containing phosphotransfer) domain-containing protein